MPAKHALRRSRRSSSCRCRAEFGYFQRLSKAYDGKVAFLARSVGAGLGWPTTIFYDAQGKRRFVRQGGYTSQGLLDADIRAYAPS